MPRSTLEQWRVFLAVASHESYAGAAETLHKSVSSVHAALRKLQDTLGVELVEVDGRRMRLTDAGRQLERRAGALLESTRTLESLAATLADGEESSVRLAVDTIYPRDRLHEVLAALADRFPSVHVELHDSVLGGAIDLLTHGDVDLAVTPVLPGGGTYRTLGRVRFTPVAHPDHPLHALGRSLSLDDLRTARHIVVRDSATRSERDDGWLQASDFWTVSSMDISIALIERGLGFAWLPMTRVAESVQAGRLAPLPMKKLNDRHAELYLAQASDGTAGPIVTFLAENLCRDCEGLLHD